MEEKKVSTLFEGMREDVSNYITNTLEIWKLNTYEKISKASANISYYIVFGVVIIIALFMMLVTLSLYLGELLANTWAGFGIVSVAFLLVLLVLILSKKSFKKSITNKVVSFLMEQDEDISKGKGSNKK